MSKVVFITLREKKLKVPKMKSIYTKFLSFYLLVCFSVFAQAQRIKRPDFVENVDAATLERAGASISVWIFAFIAIVIGLASVVPGYLFVTGQADEAKKWVMNILIGTAITGVFGAIVFGVAALFG